ncbi:hypothetical protein L596_021047 [Steinernema carpocapsae]|uniref:G-protein coupled receptors family 1 profile domain-containing protein n=1 Tax=Steinernema carpocapsae TaxID=34508 RepID=A0A4V6A164_STECR|nr:hypothetical protein L596_021047 [Steinernema carpocapsae]
MIPMLVSYFLNGEWHLGFIMCKIFWTVENVNKLLSVALLTIMSLERYMDICRPFNKHRKKQYKISHILLTVLIFVIFLCSPIIYYSDTTEHLILTENNTIADVKISCNSDLPDSVLPFFILYMCAFGFFLPVILISLSSILVVRQVNRQDSSLRRHSPLLSRSGRAIRSISSVVIFHFACWAPFWIAVLLTLIRTSHMSEYLIIPPQALAMMRLITSFLPYINSAGNWIFYAALNRKIQNTSRQVRERHERLLELEIETNTTGMIMRALSSENCVNKEFIEYKLCDTNNVFGFLVGFFIKMTCADTRNTKDNGQKDAFNYYDGSNDEQEEMRAGKV